VIATAVTSVVLKVALAVGQSLAEKRLGAPIA